MPLPSETLELIACPHCHGVLKQKEENLLYCSVCQLGYKVEGSTPRLRLQDAVSLSAKGSPLDAVKVAFFTIDAAPTKGLRLEAGTCCVVGRHLEDTGTTQIFNADFSMALDDHTYKVVRNYLGKSAKGKSLHDFGGFKRSADLILNDPSVSRLHAMLFFDGNEAGVLDLVSKNGTFVNDEEVERKRLKAGDQVRIGNAVLTFNLY